MKRGLMIGVFVFILVVLIFSFYEQKEIRDFGYFDSEKNSNSSCDTCRDSGNSSNTITNSDGMGSNSNGDSSGSGSSGIVTPSGDIDVNLEYCLGNYFYDEELFENCLDEIYTREIIPGVIDMNVLCGADNVTITTDIKSLEETPEKTFLFYFIINDKILVEKDFPGFGVIQDYVLNYEEDEIFEIANSVEVHIVKQDQGINYLVGRDKEFC